MKYSKFAKGALTGFIFSAAFSISVQSSAQASVDYSQSFTQCVISTGGDSPTIYVSDFQIADAKETNDLISNFQSTFWKHRTREGSAPACETRYPDQKNNRVGQSFSMPWGSAATVRAAEELEPNWKKTPSSQASIEPSGKNESLIVRQPDEAPKTPVAKPAPKPAAKAMPAAKLVPKKPLTQCGGKGQRRCQVKPM